MIGFLMLPQASFSVGLSSGAIGAEHVAFSRPCRSKCLNGVELPGVGGVGGGSVAGGGIVAGAGGVEGPLAVVVFGSLKIQLRTAVLLRVRERELEVRCLGKDANYRGEPYHAFQSLRLTQLADTVKETREPRSRVKSRSPYKRQPFRKTTELAEQYSPTKRTSRAVL